MLIDSSNFIFMKLETYESILTSQNCKLNCIKGFNKNVKIENKKSSSSNNKANNTMIVYSKSNLIRKTSGSKIIEQVQTLLGHAKIDTTLHYAIVEQTNVKNSYHRFLE